MYQLDALEDCLELTLPVDVNLINLSQCNWHQYNPRKSIVRFGCSITSLDGEDTGVPDLDSLLEYNQLNNTRYTEKDFRVPTKHSAPFAEVLSMVDVGRSHYLHMPPGGFFPWHRDSDHQTFRLIFTISGCTQDSFVWLQDQSILSLQNHKWYYINTKKKHSLFSFKDSIFAVFNVIYSPKNFAVLQNHFFIK
jgi:hypothetical protein